MQIGTENYQFMRILAKIYSAPHVADTKKCPEIRGIGCSKAQNQNFTGKNAPQCSAELLFCCIANY